MVNAYDEYGVADAPIDTRFGYTGQAWVPEAGLYYYKARMYSPTLGPFMQTDPIGYADGMNLYAYVGNDPVNGVDPTGLAVGVTSCRNFTIGYVYWRWEYPNATDDDDGGRYGPPQDVQAVTANICWNSGAEDSAWQTRPKDGAAGGLGPQSVACPVGQPAVITAPFGEPRGGGRGHSGVDLRARMGAPIFAPFRGTVRSVFAGGRGGDSILIDNADGSVSGFAHTGALNGLRSGQTVRPGQQIGVSNGSGTGAPHLHLTHRVTATSPKSDPLATAIGGACNATPK